MSDWNRYLAEAISQVGAEGFAPALDHACETLFPYEISMCFAYEGARTPVPLWHNMAAQTAQVVVTDYCVGPYLLDPIYAEIEAGRRSGTVALRQLAPDMFFQSEYYSTHYNRTGIRDEIGVFAAIGPGRVAVLSFTRQRGAPLFSARAKTRLAEVAPVIEALMIAHWGSDQRGAAPEPPAPSTTPPLQVLLDRLAQGVLTARETEVIAMVLRGYSSAAIAATLDISDETVKVHRKNAYRKLGISSQAQLFSLFVAALEPA